MEILKITHSEPTVDLRLTQTELNTIVTNYGMGNFSDAREFSESRNYKILDAVSYSKLYASLRKQMKELHRSF